MSQPTEALSVFKRAYELEKDSDEAKKLYGLVALYSGQEKITNDLLGPGPIMDSRFLTAYKITKHYDLMMAYLEKKVEENKNNLQLEIQSRVALANGNLIMGNRTKAVSILQDVKKMTNDPSVSSQIDSFIKDIWAGKDPFDPANK